MRLTTAEKLQRLVSIVSWVAEQGEVPIQEVCERFGISRAELVNQLEMASMVGAESEEFGDMPISVVHEGDTVSVFLMAFNRPFRLTPAQALAIVAAGTGLHDLQGADPDGPLARALAKVAAVLGVEPGDAVGVDLGEADAQVLDLLRRAASDRRRVEIGYWSAGRDDHTVRSLDPWRVFNEGGAWYVQGWCHRAGGERIFRVDRIRGARPLDDTFTPPASLPEPVAYRAAADDPRVVLDLAPGARWVAATHPVDATEELPGGGLRVTMPAGAPAFLARLLLRLGPDAVIVSADPGADPAAAVDAARRILARYDA